jgi:hypothetical protein
MLGKQAIFGITAFNTMLLKREVSNAASKVLH